ncbi:MAG: DUF2752 domain-containing protein, partial [Planctomycetota bacterium]
VGVWLSLVATAVVLSSRLGGTVDLCLFHRVTGMPCPTCGTTRGVLTLLSGRPFVAWTWNPLVFTVLGVWVSLTVVRLLTGRSLRVRLSPRQKAVAWVAIAAAVGVNWVYLILYVG